MSPTRLELNLPDWITPLTAAWPPAGDDSARMNLVLELARTSIERDAGGPFAAAVFAGDRVVAVGINRVLPERNSVLHAEILALMWAERHFQSHSLSPWPRLTLVSSCEPCAMCLGAILWSGIRRVVSGASREDAEAAGFDEGPVFPASHAYLRERGVEWIGGVERERAAALFELYRAWGGGLY